MNDKLTQIYNIIGTLRVDGWENYEKLTYIKFMLEKLMKENDAIKEKGE